MRYVFARFRKEDEIKAYRFYVTDCLKMLTRNTAATAGDMYTTERFSELISRKPVKQESGDDIAVRMINALTGGGKP